MGGSAPIAYITISYLRERYSEEINADFHGKEQTMKVGELVRSLNKRDKDNRVYYVDKYGKHEITDVKPMLTKDGTVTIIMNGDGGRYE